MPCPQEADSRRGGAAGIAPKKAKAASPSPAAAQDADAPPVLGKALPNFPGSVTSTPATPQQAAAAKAGTAFPGGAVGRTPLPPYSNRSMACKEKSNADASLVLLCADITMQGEAC